jgi:hypothetical protein
MFSVGLVMSQEKQVLYRIMATIMISAHDISRMQVSFLEMLASACQRALPERVQNVMPLCLGL